MAEAMLKRNEPRRDNRGTAPRELMRACDDFIFLETATP
jgi:hypothetical protein